MFSTKLQDDSWTIKTIQTLSGQIHSQRRRRDLNPRAAINDLLPFQGSPFGQLGYFSITARNQNSNIILKNGEGGIRTHAPLRTNGFQDRLVMTTSIPLHILHYSSAFRDMNYITTEHLQRQQLFSILPIFFKNYS